jgi:flagellar basal-body rod modification protein FlgD
MSTIGAATGAFKDFTQDVFLKLFVTQLKHQDPMEPMDNYEFTSQLAQMGQLEQISELSSNFEKFLRIQELGNASALIGCRVRYNPEDGSAPKEGLVTGVRLHEGEVKLVVGDELVSFSAVTEILQGTGASSLN